MRKEQTPPLAVLLPARKLTSALRPPASSPPYSRSPYSANQSAVREKYLTTALTHLSKALTGDEKNEDNRRAISRCVYLLKTFLHGFQRKEQTNDLVLKIVPEKECRCDPFTLTLPSDTPV
jgi:hypothetical protein